MPTEPPLQVNRKRQTADPGNTGRSRCGSAWDSAFYRFSLPQFASVQCITPTRLGCLLRFRASCPAWLCSLLLAQRLLRGVSGTPRVSILVGLAIATPLAVLFSLLGGLLGPHMVVIYALVPFLVLVGIPMLILAIWRGLRRASGPADPPAGADKDGA